MRAWARRFHRCQGVSQPRGAYLAECLAGTDVVLTAFSHQECFDLARRVQGYLLEWGQLQPGSTAALKDGARAYAGDLIVARRNDNHREAGWTLANGDLLRVQAISDSELTVVRQIRSASAGDPITWSAPFTISNAYAREYCDLGYALTWYTVEGRTVSVGIGVVNGDRARRGLYVAMSRGASRNEIYAYPSAHEPAVSTIGRPPAADPEITRQRTLHAERHGAGPVAALDQKDPIAILAAVVRRQDADLSATETREQALSDADHLGVLHAIWTDQCRAEAHARYTAAVRDHAAPADAAEILKDTDTVWRTVRAAEYAGLDGGEVIRQAIEGRPFTGARSHPAVLDARIRKNTGHLPPAPRASWTASLPRSADPDMARTWARSPRRWTTGNTASAPTPRTSGRYGPCKPSARYPTRRRPRRMGAQGRAARRIQGDHWMEPPRRGHRPRARTRQPRSLGRMARRVRGHGADRRHRRPPPIRRAAPGQKAIIRGRNIMGTRARRRRTAGSPQTGAVQQG
jgi:hypothetical protein